MTISRDDGVDEEMGGALGNLRQRMTSGISDEVFGEKSVTPDEATAEKNALRDKVSPKWLVMVRILSQPMVSQSVLVLLYKTTTCQRLAGINGWVACHNFNRLMSCFC